MDPLSPLPAVAAVLVLLGCGWLLGLRRAGAPEGGRFASIDGLRGLLAFCVFLHHSAYWYFYARTGEWGGIESNLYRHFGESGVMLFFMITAFLFTSKLIDQPDQPINWQRLFIGRVMRLLPLYLLAMLVLFTLVAVATDFTLRVPPTTLLRGAAIWLGFSIFGQPDLNGLPQTTLLLAGVTWSLPYEWLFYALLPVLALFRPARAAPGWVLFGLAVSVLISCEQYNPLAIRSFVGGIVAAFAVRSSWLRSRLASPVASLLALACAAFAVYIRPSAYSLATFPFMAMAFIIIACGNTLFGLLVTRAATTIGEMGYSLYLLHGALLLVTFRYVIGLDATRQLSPVQHWAVILVCVPVLVMLCSATFRWIEAPGMAATGRVDRWLSGLRKPKFESGSGGSGRVNRG